MRVIRHQFTNRHDGDVRKKDLTDTVFPEQIHGSHIAVTGLNDAGHVVKGADGLVSRITGKEEIALAVRVADCVPLLAWDANHGVIGVAHAGWRGTLQNITGKLIVAMQELGANTGTINVVIGPHIGMCCYNVPKDRSDRFLSLFHNDPKISSFFLNAWHIDLAWANFTQAVGAGVSPKHIRAPVVCTSCQFDTYYSFRKDSVESFGEQMGRVFV